MNDSPSTTIRAAFVAVAIVAALACVSTQASGQDIPQNCPGGVCPTSPTTVTISVPVLQPTYQPAPILPPQQLKGYQPVVVRTPWFPGKRAWMTLTGRGLFGPSPRRIVYVPVYGTPGKLTER